MEYILQCAAVPYSLTFLCNFHICDLTHRLEFFFTLLYLMTNVLTFGKMKVKALVTLLNHLTWPFMAASK